MPYKRYRKWNVFFNEEKKLQRKLYETQRTDTQLIKVPAEENQRQQNYENIIQ